MAGRRGARSGRGWDALPPRPANRKTDEPATEGELRRGTTGRGNVSGRRRSSPGGWGDAERDFGEAGESLGGDGADWSTADWSTAPGSAPGRSAAGGSAAGGSAAGGSAAGRLAAGGSAAGRLAAGGSARGRSAAGGSAAGELSEAERAREICLRQLAVRPRTRAELAKALGRQQISAEVIAEVLDRYDEVGIIDDAAFARAWVSSRHHGRGLARRALANELRQRGVDAEVADEALGTLDEDEEAATARALVERKLRSARGTPEAVFRRLVGMLARKGYPAGVAIRAVKDALAQRDAEAAEFADQIDADALADEATES